MINWQEVAVVSITINLGILVLFFLMYFGLETQYRYWYKKYLKFSYFECIAQGKLKILKDGYVGIDGRFIGLLLRKYKGKNVTILIKENKITMKEK